MNIKNKHINIIVKGKTPSWRPNQPSLSFFKSTNKGNKFNPHKSVESQFSPEELARISNSVMTAKAMGSPSIGDGKASEDV